MIRAVTHVLLLATSTQLVAETVYIRDTLYVPLRGGQPPEHRILHRGLKNGPKLERLETNEETGYSRVRTKAGLEGWLQSQYLVTEPIAIQRLEGITAELHALETQHQQTLLRLRDVTEANEAKQRLARELQEITTLAADTISIDEENVRLNDKQLGLANRVDELMLANMTLQNNDSQQWFLQGVATIMLGLLFGLWIGRRIYPQRNGGGGG